MSRALGRYELLRPLARGGMAEVYLARRRAAGVEKWLVVKRMRPERSGDPRFLDLFVREARLSMSLAHQNIVPVFDFGRIDDQVFLAMERVEGKDLGSSLARGTGHRTPALLAAFIAAECCQALDYAHQRKGPDGVALGIVHRDVTPRNVLLSWSGEVKLTDFGIAALAGDATSRLLGTPQYMAPEQARSEAIDPRADIYAIGLVLREAVTGVRPRPGADRDAMLEAARRGELVPWPTPDPDLALGSGEPTLPPVLIEIIERATAAAAADRYPDARTMLADLDAFIVADRAAHKGESPARQLADWLSGVWEGARDDADSDAAIQAEHLVSFLDDGAIDVAGTGTMRSLALTAAEEVLADPLGAAAAISAPPPDKPTVIVAPPPPPPRADNTGRASRISSSTTTVASGSFHTIPTTAEVRRAHRVRPRGRWLSPAASLILVALAAGGLVFWVMSSFRGASRDPAVATAPAPATAQPAETAPAVAPPPAVPADASQAVAPPGAGSAAAAAAAGPTPPPRPRPVVHPPRPEAGHAAQSGIGSAAPAPVVDQAPPPPPPRPRTCRVRINLTPWAYYTTDEDSTQRETPGTVDLTPGPHRIHVWNPQLKIERDIIINVPADRDTMNYSEPLQPATLHPDAGL